MTKDTYSESWRQRFGSEPLQDFPDLAPILGHRSHRLYSPEPLPEAVIEALKGAAQSAATSSHKQLWSAVTVQDPERREQISHLCGDQAQVRTAPFFAAFCADHYRLREAALEAGQDPTGLPYKEHFIVSVIDAALAAERMCCAAEILGLGICYIGALRNKPREVRELLRLPEGVVGLFGLCIGAPAPEATAAVKPRFSLGDCWHQEIYHRSVDLSEFNDRMKAFYEGQGMKGEHTWASRTGRQTTVERMSGREAFGEFVREQGLDLK